MIQKATMEQLPRLLDIYRRARAFMARTGNPNQWGDNRPSPEQIIRDIREGKCYVNLEGDQILAVFFYAQGDDPTYHYIEDGAWLNDAPYGVIHRIAVDVPGKGAAAECFRFALEQCDNLRIDTHSDNLPMQQCLRKNGFRRCGIIYLEDGDSRIAFQKVKE